MDSILFSFNFLQGDILSSWQMCNVPGKVIIWLLFIFSIGAWTIMVTKILELSRARRRSRLFVRAFRRELDPVALFLKPKGYSESPVSRIYEVCCNSLGSQLGSRRAKGAELFSGDLAEGRLRLTALQLEGVRNLSERNVADEALMLERHVGFLATAVSTAPFLGLLGTVWGVMEAFAGMAVTGTPTLSAVTPGISAALLTTVVGLLVALPSAIGYNVISTQVRSMAVQMDNFAQELVSSFQHHFVSEQD